MWAIKPYNYLYPLVASNVISLGSVNMHTLERLNILTEDQSLRIKDLVVARGHTTYSTLSIYMISPSCPMDQPDMLYLPRGPVFFQNLDSI